MKLLFVCESFPTLSHGDFTGGVEARDFYIARELALKHQVIVLTNARFKTPSRQNLGNIRIVRVGLPLPHQYRNNPFSRIIFVFASILNSLFLAADLVQGSNIFTQLPAFLIGIIKNKTKVALVHDVFIGQWFRYTDPITAFFGEILERLVLRLPWDQIIINSRATKVKLDHFIKKTSPTAVIYGGVDYQACRRLRVTKNPYPTIVFAGRLVKYKKVADLITALPLIIKKIPAVRLHLIGSGPQLSHLKQLTARLKLEPEIKFLGFYPRHRQVLKTLKKSHLFCLPSAVEGFGLVTLEAMSCGLPFVNADIPATREITRGGSGGLLFPPGNYRQLAKKVVSLLTHKYLYQKKQRQGQRLAASYDWSIIAAETEKIFQKCISK